jgi:NADH-quinone oxidoreductase subunit J
MGERFIPLAVACAVALVSALGVILPRRPVHGAIALLVHSLSLAAIYLAMNAEVVGISQVIIYSGAVVVLFLFVVLLLPTGGRESRFGPRRYLTAALGGGAFFMALVSAVVVQLPAAPDQSPGSVAEVGRSLFDPLLVPFELTAPMLLIAIVGAVTLWRRLEPSAPAAGRRKERAAP